MEFRKDAPLIALIAGEASGDILGAGLMQSLQSRYPGARFIGVGGSEMAEAGLDSLFPMEKLSVMGITEVLAHLPELLRLRKQLVRFLLEQKPDVVIGIDSPDFTLPIERRLHEQGLKTVHYVSPSVWAWRQGRIKGIKKSIDLMLCLLPFEARFYEEHQVPVAFVGHPLADRVPLQTDTFAARQTLDLSPQATLIAVLPGSRGGEVGQLMPIFIEAMVALSASRPELHYVIPAANAARREQIEALLEHTPGLPVTLVDGESRTVMAAADVILMSSGTATLEGLLVGKPMVVGYRVGKVTYAIASRLVKSEFVSLPNLLCREAMVPELIQDDLTCEAIVTEVKRWLDNPDKAQALISRFQAVHEQLRGGASEKAADAVSQLLER